MGLTVIVDVLVNMLLHEVEALTACTLNVAPVDSAFDVRLIDPPVPTAMVLMGVAPSKI
jgi:hypothetical protein